MTLLHCHRLATLLALGLLLGCPTAAEDDDSGDDDDASDDDASDDDTGDGGLIGGLQIREIQVDNGPPGAMAALWVYGLYDRPAPGQIFGVVAEAMLEPTIVAGDCVYLEKLIPPLCDPPCGYDEYCAAEGVCEPWPELRPAGVMTVSGLSAPLTLTPSDAGWYHLDQELPEDLFDAGDAVVVEAEGDQWPAFLLEAIAVETLTPALPCDLDLQPGQDLVLQWDPPANGGRIRWEIFSMLHAGNGPMVLCEAEDTGTLTVSAAIIDAYLPDRTSFETTQLSRFSQATTDLGNGYSVALELGSVRACY